MPARGALWRIVRPLEEGATAPWLRLYYNLLHELCSAVTPEDVVQIAIRSAYETFRADIVAAATLDGDAWEVLPYRQNDTRAEPLRIPVQDDPRGPVYEPGQVVDIPDVPAFARDFPALEPLVARGIRSMVSASFGSHVHERGYLAFCSQDVQHYSDDEYTLMCLYALAVGIALDRVGGSKG